MHKQDFPIFEHHPNLVYLDSAATTQKPQVVIDAISSALEYGIGSPGRGLYPLSTETTEKIEATRLHTAQFLGSNNANEIVFTANATESLNLIAFGLRHHLNSGDEIIISSLEHNSVIIPWQQLVSELNIVLKFINYDEQTKQIDYQHLSKLISDKTRLVCVSHTSNVFGSSNDLVRVKKILIEKGSDALFVSDATQAASSTSLSVHDLCVDFLIFSSHKVYGPSGVGILWGREDSLKFLTPLRSGGGTAEKVTTTSTIFKDGPERFEGGTANIEGIIGFDRALSYIKEIGMENIKSHQTDLTSYVRQKLSEIPEVTLLSPLNGDVKAISFLVNDVHPHDVAQYLSDHEICIRAGQHCAGSIFEKLQIPGSSRISFGIYNEISDIDTLILHLKQLINDFHVKS